MFISLLKRFCKNSDAETNYNNGTKYDKEKLKKDLYNTRYSNMVISRPLDFQVASIDLDSKIFQGQSVAQSFAWTCSALSKMHVSYFKVLAKILYKL